MTKRIQINVYIVKRKTYTQNVCLLFLVNYSYCRNKKKYMLILSPILFQSRARDWLFFCTSKNIYSKDNPAMMKNVQIGCCEAKRKIQELRIGLQNCIVKLPFKVYHILPQNTSIKTTKEKQKYFWNELYCFCSVDLLLYLFLGNFFSVWFRSETSILIAFQTCTLPNMLECGTSKWKPFSNKCQLVK